MWGYQTSSLKQIPISPHQKGGMGRLGGVMKILIIDDSKLWIEHGKKLLEQSGHEVTGFQITEPKEFTSTALKMELMVAIRKSDMVLVDKDFGDGVTSTPLICVIRNTFPKLPIVRWTSGSWRNDKPYMKYLGVTEVHKPTKQNEVKFVETFNEAVDEQKLILSGSMGIFAALDETAQPDKYAAERKAKQLQQIAQIAQLANKDRADSGDPKYSWATTPDHSGGMTKHELGHCICDGYLTADEIRPYLPALQKVIAKFEAADEIDNRFKTCAEFIKVGNLEELELVHNCF
ncbi:MAG: hypothetical protein A2174_01350 [Candidatus Portnoybacteria bacterium RBG_13_41_18]|uniref:Uncharacterized protein n=1 Tax=Candidatus Portnoybacteria bacterium RBG_13_41_18 TaxID=1801991 RepID=A0A1G2F740_9BACT|nr:MAG: hypothetical protein A2174_01350 [Candidatus Portnoybacteria bacterium RBG_13_41_18]